MDKNKKNEMNYLKDFMELSYETPEAFISMVLGKTSTLVVSEYTVRRLGKKNEKLFFDGLDLEFLSVSIAGKELSSDDYKLSSEGVEILKIPEEESFKIKFENKIYPDKNLELEGLYVSGDMLCTQNEPMGFRRITYAIDRPDNMVKVKVKLLGDKKVFPFMLANGNLIEEGKAKGVDFCVWEDPFPKPLYLFAVVAGDLAELTDTYITKSGKEVAIKFYCDHGSEKKCDFAIESLKKSMKWDEDRFNLEYDLDLYMVVAADSFNMGAMENKGLNIFNSALVLANPLTATDLNYHRIESVIGHEYFHNWTGNRVTVKNWFQLTLKEGLTVFRDQEFSSDLNDKAVERIDMVNSLKERQFVEDAGPLAHPIRPNQYKEMNNFYTSTVYEKGAEIIRMLHTFLGEEKFQEGMKEYFKKYDGRAITTEDFLEVMCKQDPRIDQEAFSNWYKTPGTPEIKIIEDFNGEELKITFRQQNKISSSQNLGSTEAYLPVKISIYDSEGKKVSLLCEAKEQEFLDEGLLVLSKSEETFVFKNIPHSYQVSYFEGFSAPVLYKIKSESRDLSKLIRIDQDHFNKYNSVKESALEYIKGNDQDHINSLRYVLKDNGLSSLMKAQMLEPPVFNDLIEGVLLFDPLEIDRKRSDYIAKVGNILGGEFLDYLKDNPFGRYEYSLKQKGDRALYFCLLRYVVVSDEFRQAGKDHLKQTYKNADNMTNSFSCLSLAQLYSVEGVEEISNDFYKKNKDDQLTLQKWIQAYLSVPNLDEALLRVNKVEGLEGFSYKIPNFVRALWRSFINMESVFHEKNGKGYKAVLTAVLKIDKINPMIASGIMKAFNIGPRLSGDSALSLRAELEKFAEQRETFSKHLRETFESIYAELR